MKRSPHTTDIAIAACVIELSGGAAPTEFKLMPAGISRARDGRPAGVPGWKLDATLAAKIIDLNAAKQDALVVDYEHQTLYTAQNGQPAPAAGWLKGAQLEWRADGLWATNVEWTAAASAAIAAKEYRYISPVIKYDRKTGDVLDIVMAALTNFAAIDGLTDLNALAAARFNLDQINQEDTPMLEALRKLLGLADTATETEITAAITALKGTADTADATIAALKAQAPDPAKYVPLTVVQGLQEQVAALSGKINGNEVDALVADGLKDGRILPEMETWARDLGSNDVASLKGYLDKAKPIPALRGKQSGNKGPGDDNNPAQLDEAALAVCRQMGIDPEEYKKTAAAA